MALYGNVTTATASVALNTNVVTVAGLDLSVVKPGMTISFGFRDRKSGIEWVISGVTPNGTNGGTITTQANVTTAYTDAPFLIDTTGYLSTDASYAAVVGLTILSALQTLLGIGTSLAAGARQIVLDKVSATAVGRVLFSIAGRVWGAIEHRTLTYTPTGGTAATIETLAFRAFPDGATPVDALLLDLSTGTGDLRKGTTSMLAASVLDLGSAPVGKVSVSGSAAINSFGSGRHLERLVHFFEGGNTITHNATSLVLPGGANIVTGPGDCLHVTSDASGNWRLRAYQRATGRPLLTPTVVAGNSGPTVIPAGATRFLTNSLVSPNAFNVYVLAGRRGIFRNLRVVGVDTPGPGQTVKFTLQKLFSDTALTCTMANGNAASDLVNSVLFEAGDRWSIKAETSAGANALSNYLFTMDFEVLG
ncbi:hypothetical protein [Methylorubrum extorquens]